MECIGLMVVIDSLPPLLVLEVKRWWIDGETMKSKIVLGQFG